MFEPSSPGVTVAGLDYNVRIIDVFAKQISWGYGFQVWKLQQQPKQDLLQSLRLYFSDSSQDLAEILKSSSRPTHVLGCQVWQAFRGKSGELYQCFDKNGD